MKTAKELTAEDAGPETFQSGLATPEEAAEDVRDILASPDRLVMPPGARKGPPTLGGVTPEAPEVLVAPEQADLDAIEAAAENGEQVDVIALVKEVRAMREERIQLAGGSKVAAPTPGAPPLSGLFFNTYLPLATAMLGYLDKKRQGANQPCVLQMRATTQNVGGYTEADVLRVVQQVMDYGTGSCGHHPHVPVHENFWTWAVSADPSFTRAC